MKRIDHHGRRLSMMWMTILITFVCALCGQATTVLAQATNTFPASGNVGIGTTTPNDRLVVYGSNIKSIFGDSTTHTNIYSTYNTQSWNAMEIYTNGGIGSHLVFTSNVTSGAIGGITFANKGAGVEGTNDLRVGGFFAYTDGAANSGYVNFWTANAGTFAERMRITSAGNVGIGTNAPWSKLTVAGSIGTTGNISQSAGATRGDWGIFSDGNPYIYSTFQFGKQTTTSNAPADIVTWNFQYSLAASGIGYDRNFGLVGWRKDGGYTVPMYFQENGNVVFNQYGTINGNVGIGTINPAYKLDVNGIINATAIYQNGVPLSGSSQWMPSGSSIYYSAGSVGVGTNAPTAKFEVSGTPATSSNLVKFSGADSNGNLFNEIATTGMGGALLKLSGGGGTSFVIQSTGVYSGPGNNKLVIAAPSGVLFTLNSDGNTGIGTTTPSSKLDVAGQVRSSTGGFIFPDGTVQTTAATGSGTSQWTPNGSSISYSSGSVGIGTAAPDSALHVAGGSLFALPKPGQASWTSAVFSNNYDATVRLLHSGAATTFYTDSVTQAINFSTNGAGNSRLYISGGGSVGIGTTTPTARLDVNGNVNVTGDITATGNIAAKYQDVAEWVSALHVLPAATVVVLNPLKSNQVMASSTAYDTRVAGVVSSQPGIVLGEGGEGKVMVATTGRVRVKVDATRAPIHIGDLLVTSGKEGMAMRSEPIMIGGRQIHTPGTLIGKALESLESGTGEILVLLSLQ